MIPTEKTICEVAEKLFGMKSSIAQKSKLRSILEQKNEETNKNESRAVKETDKKGDNKCALSEKAKAQKVEEKVQKTDEKAKNTQKSASGKQTLAKRDEIAEEKKKTNASVKQSKATSECECNLCMKYSIKMWKREDRQHTLYYFGRANYVCDNRHEISVYNLFCSMLSESKRHEIVHGIYFISIAIYYQFIWKSEFLGKKY